MQIVTKEQLYSRWEQVPVVLKEAFFSLENGELIWKACEDAGLSEEVTGNVLDVVGNILFGFTHINDLARELQSIPGMDAKAVDSIIFQIDKRIFDPVRLEIVKLYGAMAGDGPAVIASAETEPVRSGSVEVEEMGMAEESVRPAVIAEGAPTTEEAAVDVQTTQVDIRKVKIGGEAAQETPIRRSEEGQAEGPAIIHEEAELKAVAQKKRPLSSFGGLFGFNRGAVAKPQEGPTIAAQVSIVEGIGKRPFGGLKTEPQEIARTEQQPVKVVHYTSAKAPEDIFGQMENAQEHPKPAVPVTKQEHAFEPMMMNAAEREDVKAMPMQGEAIPAEAPGNGSSTSAVPAVGQQDANNMVVPPVVVMKTPQRPEPVDGIKKQEAAPKLADIPVTDDIVDLRTLERMPDKK